MQKMRGKNWNALSVRLAAPKCLITRAPDNAAFATGQRMRTRILANAAQYWSTLARTGHEKTY